MSFGQRRVFRSGFALLPIPIAVPVVSRSSHAWQRPLAAVIEVGLVLQGKAEVARGHGCLWGLYRHVA